VLRQLLGLLPLEGVLIQADALHTQRRCSPPPGPGGQLPAYGQSQAEAPVACSTTIRLATAYVVDTVHVAPDPHPVPGKAHDPFRGNCSREEPWPRHHLAAAGYGGTGAH
jgi:hypothetical protein